MPHEREKTKGEMEQVKGKAKEELGKLGGDSSTELSGKGEQLRGKVREELADARGNIEHREDPQSEVERKP